MTDRRQSRLQLRRERLLVAFLVGAALFVVSFLTDRVLLHYGVNLARTIWDNLVIGFFGAIAAYLWARYEAERQARARERMILLVELNHHIRNALTVLAQTATLAEGPEKLRLIDEAVERVDRVLTDLVPTVGDRAVPRLYLEEDPKRPEPSHSKS